MSDSDDEQFQIALKAFREIFASFLEPIAPLEPSSQFDPTPPMRGVPDMDELAEQAATPIYPPLVMFGGLIAGSALCGLGFDCWHFRKRRTLGALAAVWGFLIGAYAVFYPLLFGGY